jgi:hypothetical protein
VSVCSLSVCLSVCLSHLSHRDHVPSLCIDHDQEQTPQGALPPPPPPPPVDGWDILEPGKIPQPNPDNVSVFLLYQATTTDTYEHCAAVAATAVAAGNNTAAHYFSWWGHVDSPSRGGNVTTYRCWLSTQAGWEKGYAPASGVHVVSGFRGVPRPAPAVAWGDGACPGDCDCGAGLPCGEYLFGNHASEQHSLSAHPAPRTASSLTVVSAAATIGCSPRCCPPQIIGTRACGSIWWRSSFWGRRLD